MAAATATIIALTGLALAGASAGYQVKSARDAADEAADQGRKAEAAQREQMDKLKKQQDKQSADEAAAKAEADTIAAGLEARDSSRKRQRALSGNSTRKGGTVLTSPLGLPGDYEGSGQKTLLG